MKKRFLISWILLVSIFVSMGCMSKESTGGEDVFSFETAGNTILLGSVYEKGNFGKELEYSENHTGLDKTYRFQNYKITTTPIDGKEIISSIYFLDDRISTKEGLKITDSLEKMIEVYKENYQIEGTKYSYKLGNTSLNFIVENKVITSIEYSLNKA